MKAADWQVWYTHNGYSAESPLAPYSMGLKADSAQRIIFLEYEDPALQEHAEELYDKANTVEYYPITLDEDCFYYTQNYSPDNHADQLFKGWFDGRTSKYLPFNKSNADYSDAYPVSAGWLFLVSTRSGGKGQYDLYIANENSGSIYSLNTYNAKINTSLNELGPAYTTAR